MFGEGTIRRFLFLHGITRKRRPAHASEQDRPDVIKRRQDWLDGQPALDPKCLVFIDKIWASTNMARRYGCSPRGERPKVGIPHGHWKTTTFVAGITCEASFPGR